MLKHKINLSLLAQDSTPIINLVQMDTGRELECTITDFSIPVGATAKLWVIKPSGKIVSANGAIDGNIITVALSDQQVVESGLAVAQLKISSAGKIISSFSMYLNFQEDASTNGIISTEDIKLVDAFLQEQSKKLDDAIALKTAQIQKNTQDVTTLKEDLTKLDTSFKTLSLGIDSRDNLLYIFHNGSPVGDGVAIDGATGVRYKITYNLENATVSYNPLTVAEKKQFSTVIVANNGFTITGVTITMGGTDITSSAYLHGAVNIPSVIGDIVITVITKAIPSDITNTKIFNADLTNWSSSPSITDTITGKTFAVNNADKTANISCTYYANEDTAESEITKKGWTSVFVWDKRLHEACQFYCGFMHSMMNHPTIGVGKWLTVNANGPFYNNSNAYMIQIYGNPSLEKWKGEIKNLPDINTFIASYGNNGTVKYYLNGILIYTHTVNDWQNWKMSRNNIFNVTDGFKVCEDQYSSRFKGITKLALYEGSITDKQALQLSNFFLN